MIHYKIEKLESNLTNKNLENNSHFHIFLRHFNELN